MYPIDQIYCMGVQISSQSQIKVNSNLLVWASNELIRLPAFGSNSKSVWTENLQVQFILKLMETI